MERKIDSRLAAWKARSDKKPLMLFGARQTGKTTSVLDFARRCYGDVVHIDFYKQPRMKAAFSQSLEPEKVVAALEALLNRDIDAKTTLLFLDEAQECDEAITALKFFRTDMPELDVIAAGSLLGVHVSREGSFPVGNVDMITMHPMDFEEFCWAVGQARSFDLVRDSFETGSPCPVHDAMLDRYRDYLLIGGMPEAVSAWGREGRLSRVREIQRDIRTAYVADMAKYATGTDAAKIVACWESLPSQLAKESGSTKFTWTTVEAGGKAQRYRGAVDWLVASGIVSKCTQVSDGVAPLASFENASSFKLYAADTGLLASAYDAMPADFDDTDRRSARFRGGIAENYVMQQLCASETKAYYWGAHSTHEVEFVARIGDHVTPIEVKSGRRVRSTSAQRFAERYGCPSIIRLSQNNFGEEGIVRSVPLYAACLVEGEP